MVVSADRCRSCRSPDLVDFYRVEGIPTQTCVLLDDAATALAYPTGDIRLALCRTCGFIQNTSFESDKVDYSVPTEESQAYSPRFRAFSDSLAEQIWSRHALAGKSVLEIGCGKGDFLADLAELGVAAATGIDPGFLPNRNLPDGSLDFIRDWFDERYTEVTADMIVARHVLEHIPEVLDFTSLMVDSARRTQGSAVFIEVPDTVRVLREGAFWDVYYEHCSYFTPVSLEGTLNRAGLVMTDMRLGFDGQYLLAEGVVADSSSMFHPVAEVEKVVGLVESFASRAEAARQRWSTRLAEVSDRGGRITLWGGGSKAVAFLASLDTGGSVIDVVDINPHKQDRFLPGSGIEVKSPDVLAESAPELVVVMNPVYEEEIANSIRKMGVVAKVVAVTG